MLRTSTTVKQARQIVGQASSRTKAEEQLELMNKVREWIYGHQSEYGIDLAMPFLVGVECFVDYDQSQRYGFRLPQTFQSIKALTINGVPRGVKGPMRTPFDGIGSVGNPYNVQTYERGDKPMERDMLEDGPIRFVTTNKEDEGIIVTGQTIEGELVRRSYTITRDFQESEDIWKKGGITAIQFPTATQGAVRLFESNRELSRYLPGTLVPLYREYILDGATAGQSVLVKANRQFEPLSDDDELVEFGEHIVWEYMARFLNMLSKSDKSANDRENMKVWLEALSI